MVRDYTLGTTFDIKFTTRRFTTGVPFALASGVISAYPGNDTTQVTAGITLSTDFDGVTGLNNVRVVATGGNGYAAGDYALVITTGTVDSVSVVGEVVGHFTIQRSATFDRVGAPAGASIAADVAAVKVDTAAILVDTGTTLDGRLPAALVSGRIDASVGAMAANTLTASALAADAVDEILDEVVEGTTTLRQSMRLANTSNASKLSGAGTATETIRDIGDTKDRIVATVDASGNRTAITLDVS